MQYIGLHYDINANENNMNILFKGELNISISRFFISLSRQVVSQQYHCRASFDNQLKQ